MLSGSGMKAAQELVCPKCQQTDQIQKVSGLYNANTKEWFETQSHMDSHGYTHTSQEKHTAHTLLGQQLAPPEKPKGGANPILWYGGGCLLAALIIVPTCGTLLPFVIIPLIMVPLGLFLSPETSLPSEFAWLGDLPNWVGIVLAVVLTVGLLVSIGLLVWAWTFFKRKYNASNAKYKANQARLDSEEMPRWQRAMERWNDLYYCARDETVFIPGENKAIPVAEMSKYLFDPYYRPL